MDFKAKLIFKLASASEMGDIDRLSYQSGVERIQMAIRKDRAHVYSVWGGRGRPHVGQWVRVLAALGRKGVIYNVLKLGIT